MKTWYTEELRRLRADQGMSLKELADKAGSTKSYVGQVERGLRNPSFGIVENMANALGAKVYIQLESPEPPTAAAKDKRKRTSIVSRFM